MHASPLQKIVKIFLIITISVGSKHASTVIQNPTYLPLKKPKIWCLSSVVSSSPISYLIPFSVVFCLMSNRLLQRFSSTLLRISFGTCSDLVRISFGSDRTRSEQDPYQIPRNSLKVSKETQG